MSFFCFINEGSSRKHKRKGKVFIMKKLLVVLMTGLLLVSGCSSEKDVTKSVDQAKESGFIVGLDDTFAPMGFRDDNNEVVGFDIDLAKEVSERLGFEITFQPVDWEMKETELSQGNIDVIWNGLTITEERSKVMLFSDPYMDNTQMIAVESGSDINAIADLVGKTIAVQKDSSALEAVNSNEAVRDNNTIVEYDTNIECIMDLEVGRVDAIVVDEVLGRYVMAQRGQEQYKVLEENLQEEQYGVAFRLSDTELQTAVNDTLNQMKEDGTFDSIYATWFAVN
jgi:polar amino acid transport system substrate-binding protein